MGKERREIQDNDDSMAIKEVSSRASKIDAREALRLVSNTLSGGPGNFNWVFGGQESESAVWWLRLPVSDKQLAKEKPEVLHICRPIGLWESINSNDPEGTISNSGYLSDDQTHCRRCKKELPEVIGTKFITAIKLFNLGRELKS